jgi:protease PrsW
MNWIHYISIAALGGILPALFWLWFWLHEDNLHPEPRRRVIICFLGGMLAVPLVFPFQKIIHDIFGNDSTATIVAWAALEEIFKFLIAYFFALKLKVNDEPVDALIYLITVAIGFAALENCFFLLSSLQGETLLSVFITGNLRFIGATLLHTTSSAIIGIVIGFTFYKHGFMKRTYVFLGLCGAILLHTLFNLSIIKAEGDTTVIAFYGVWFSVIALLLMFEKIKHISNPLT